MSTNANQPEQAKTTSEPSFDDLVVQVSELAEAGKVDNAAELIDRHPEHADRLRRLLPAIEALATLDEPTLGKANEPTIQSKELGDFRIVREIGRGGMGIVYEAEQLSLGRRMALKVLPLAATLSTQQLKRFKNEARLAASLKHPHTVGVHSVGVERGVHYYAMELVEGCSLAQAIANLSSEENQTESPQTDVSQTAETTPVAALSTARTKNPQDYYRQVAKMVADAADGLDYAHNQGIVHRDIKPGNLLLDADANVWVTDFGLARLETDLGVTLTGDLLGTLRYMSPEQAAGRPGMVDYRTDIHALGATLYELLALRPAFEGSDRVELLRHIADDPPTALRQIDSRIPIDLETIVAKATEKEPTDRYQSAGELAADLRAFLEHRAITAKPPSLAQRGVKWSRRHAGVVWTFASVVLLGSVLGTWLGTKHVFEQRAIAAAVESSLLQSVEALAVDEISLAQVALDQAEVQATQLEDASLPLLERMNVLNRELHRYGEFTSHDRGGRLGWDAKPALAVYGVMESDDWRKPLQEAGLPPEFVKNLETQVYALLIGQAREHVDDFKAIPTEEEGRTSITDAEKLLAKASTIRPPTKGYYWVLATCSQRMGDLTDGEVRTRHDSEAIRLRELADNTPPQSAAELYLITGDRRWGCASKKAREPFRLPYNDLDEILAAYREMLRIEPEYYPALFFSNWTLNEADKYELALQGWNGCIASRPDDLVAHINRILAMSRLGLHEESLADLDRYLTLRMKQLDAERDSKPRGWRWRYAEASYLAAEVFHNAGKHAEAKSRLLEAKTILNDVLEHAEREFITEWLERTTELLKEVDSAIKRQQADSSGHDSPAPRDDEPPPGENLPASSPQEASR